ncbi:hypothetical protein [Cupriavidus sp. DL-D2]|uniref:hypothetical protein n=1 Tax=Cupriavidus sp. DL-D2 TaxID=3144974 RepID=UPI003212BF59
MDKPLFADVSHALHVSYLVLSLPPRQKSPFKAMLIQVLDSIEHPTRAQREWLAQLTGPAMDYDPERLTMDEFRAQCAMVTDAAKNRLPSPEYAAVLARFAYGKEKLAGCQRLAVYARRSSGLTALKLLVNLTARHYLPKQQRQDLTFRALADKHGGSPATLFRAARWMETHFRTLENKALDRLEPSFTGHGLIVDRTACDAVESVAA